MSTNTKDGRETVEAVVEAVMEFIDEAPTADVEQFGTMGGDRAATVASVRGVLARVKSEVAHQRRQDAKDRVRRASLGPMPDVSHLSLAELRAILASHVANDDASKTMAARHEQGEMNEAELRSVVADILHLRRHD